NVNSGFWTPLFSPTVANATITGRVLRNDGLGIRNVVVTLAGGSLTSTRIALSSSLGYFSFDQIEPGQIYQITVTSKHYGFAEPSQTISVFGDFANIVFQSSWQN
ncbi:MAG: carboxypeptidase-like regulatory domain-containing protein, partial [Pyrinomonadaceae bacterium]